MQKTAIEWVKNPDGSQGYSWNPIKGICPVGCWYCYARKIYKRFHISQWLHFDKENYHKPLLIKKPSGIFVCSTMELFHPETNQNHWRDNIFDIIEHCPQHRFYILTKFPQNIDRKMPDNVWLGTTATGLATFRPNAYAMMNVDARLKFISFEPLLTPLHEETIFLYGAWDWVIIGKLTGYGKKYDPKKAWVREIFELAKNLNTPIFLKDNLKEIWGQHLIQEFPRRDPR